MRTCTAWHERVPTRWGYLGVALLALAPTACSMNRTESGPPTWPSIQRSSPTAPRRVYVSHFYEFTTATSETRSQDIITIRESASIKDISGELAAAMSKQGISAVGKRGFDGAGMNPDDLWVRGVATWDGVGGGAGVASVVVSICTVFVVGGILPHPFLASYGPAWKVRLEISNGKGEIVASRDSERVEVSYDTLYVWPLWGDKHAAEDRPVLIDRLGAAVASAAR
jgi:hypothetical protein